MLTLQEKMSVRGVESLSDVELLAVLLDETHLPSLDCVAQRLLDSHAGSIASIARANVARLRMVEGIGVRSATKLKAAAEWGRRVAISSAEQQRVVHSSNDVVEMFKTYFDSMKHEECWVVYLSASNGILEQCKVSQGGVTATVVDHRIVVKRALELLSTQIVMVHNHPSGVVQPSAEDINLTQRVKAAAALFDISLVDHIILSPTSAHFSFLNQGLL